MFCDRAHVASILEGKSVAICGSGPGILKNPESFVDSFDVVVRVNNFKLTRNTGYRTDVFYSYFGQAIRKTRGELQACGVRLCMAKCPDAKFMESQWHRRNGKERGVDFRWIYRERADWWFCPTYVPTLAEFMETFKLLGGHVPTTGFAAVRDVLSYKPSSIYMTGFDFFESRIHNVNERWRVINTTDPIRHRPQVERDWVRANLGNYPITMDEDGLAAISRKSRRAVERVAAFRGRA